MTLNRIPARLLLPLFLTTLGGVSVIHAQETDPFHLLREKDLDGALERLGAICDAGHFWERDQSDGLPALVGRVARLLAQEDEEQQYDLLYEWTMPTESRKSIRVFTSPVPHVAPPEFFARVLRERPRKTSFEVSSINGIRGLYCTGWNLVNLADSLGRLDRLTTELEELNQQQISDADVMLLLAKMVHRQPDLPFVRDNLPNVIERVGQTGPKGVSPDKVLHPSILALGAAALGRDELAPMGEAILRKLRDKANFLPAYRMRGFLHAAQAVAEQQALSDSPADFLYDNQLKYWVPVANEVSGTSVEGSTPPIWLTHEDHILHLTGVYNDVLFFRYPLTGEFEFVAEVQSTAPKVSNASSGYGGLFFQSLGVTRDLTVWDADLVQIHKKPCPFAREQAATSFNRVSIRSTPENAQYAVNRHPMWTDPMEEAAASPFIGFRYYGNHRSLIRNLELTGHPVIPREVLLTSGTQLRGWRSHYFGESKRTANADQFPGAGYRWFMENGELLAPRIENETSRQSRLSYQRPLLEAEKIRYEFYYVPGESGVHPSLGRLAFLIEPGGVNIHWITDGALEWTGLPENNATFEPLNRRGSRPLPLKEADWNAVELTRADNKIKLSLNGESIYERPLDFAGDTNFGLFRDPSKYSVRVRNVILSGDWPETVPAEFLQNPTAVIDEDTQTNNRLSLHSMAGPDLLSANFNVIRRHAASLAPTERYEFLVRWVLPSDVHPDIRMTGEFTQTDPSPLAMKLEPHRFGDTRGAELVSPAYDLLDTAVELGRIEDLSRKVDAIPDASDLEQLRAKRALQIMIALEQQDRQLGQELADQLQLLLHESFRLKVNDYRPELHLITRALRRHDAHHVIAGLIADLFEQRFSFGSGNFDRNHIFVLMREYQAVLYGLPAPRDAPLAGLTNWIPVSRANSRSRGAGAPQLRWTFDNAGMLMIGSGHDRDYLFYRSPLVGNYEVHSKMARYGSSSILIGGRFAGSGGNGQDTLVGTYRNPNETTKVTYPFSRQDASVYYRGHVKDGRVRALLNGQMIFDHQPDDVIDPWIGLRGISYSNTAFHDVEIVGNPTIPDEVPMTTADNLGSWLDYYPGTKEFTWNRLEDETGRGIIQSGRRPDLAGSHFEGLLRYHRPLWEDGTVGYEFLYSPGRYMAHPALDRLVFLLDPGGVKIHWLTDEKYDDTAVPPDNVTEEPENRRGPSSLPLKPDEWNRLKLSIAGQTVALELNDTLIYERELEETNHRTFGLFHFADRNELFVSNPVMRADWPKTLPAVVEQELTDPALAAADRNLTKLKKIFHHDFSKDGLPEKYFKTGEISSQRQVVVEPGGVRVTVMGTAPWFEMPIITRFSVQGNFDIQAEVVELNTAGAEKEAAAFIDLEMNDEQQHLARIFRRWTSDSGHGLNAQISPVHPNGHRSWLSQLESEAAPYGTLRISRIGKRILFSYAEEDSDVFRVIRDEVITDADVLMDGIELKTAFRERGRASALWKNITIRAEQMKYLPSYERTELNQLWIMNDDGSNVRKLTGLLPGMTNMGSPEFSRDGKQIALDMSQGSVASSHIIVLNSDGTNVRDLGSGCMPSFSLDGEKIVFSEPGSGIMLMDADGTNREVVDRSGWGVQFSPDGKSIAYGKSGNITLLNLETKQSREILAGADATRYSYTYWNLGWSHDSKSIAFKGRLRTGGDQVVVVEIDDGSLTVLDPDATNVNPDFTFSSDNQAVLFSKRMPSNPGAKLYRVHRKSPGELELLKGQPEDRTLESCAVSPEGNHIAFTGLLTPQPVEWNPREEKTPPPASDSEE